MSRHEREIITLFDSNEEPGMRRSESMQSLDSTGSFQDRARRGRGGGRGGGNRNDDDSNVEWKPRPMTYGFIRDIIDKPPNDIILSLIDNNTGLKERLELPQIDAGFLSILLKALSRAFSTTLHPTNQNVLMGLLVSTGFFERRVSLFTSSKSVKDHVQVFEYLANIFEVMLDRMPEVTVEEFEMVIGQCASTAEYLAKSGSVDAKVVKKLRDIQEKINELLEGKAKEKLMRRKVNLDLASCEDDPPEDFREIGISPAVDEIKSKGRPFLRSNVINGKYKNVDHYLDVHFRLLREDFIAPLRMGILDYLNRDKSDPRKKRIREIRLYNQVKIQKEQEFNRDGTLYVLNFNVGQFRNIKWEISRRLIFGSLLCLSDDNFESAIFASVADRKADDLKKGLIKVRFEDEFHQKRKLTKFQLDSTYVMAESQAYFEAYRHVLRGLQTYTGDSLPLQQYIIQVQRFVQPPAYLDYASTYDFSSSLANTDLPNSRPRRNSFVSDDGSDVEMEGTDINRNCLWSRVVDIRTWPSEQDLGLDPSQRRAMHLALSSALAIIQGPPGTGKTYVGLKIVRALLNNKNVWRSAENSTPILVVCLTNHALDQFLEGMLSFTTKIVRVGGRSKNERLFRYNLRKLQERMVQEKTVPKNIYGNMRYVERKLRDLRTEIENEKYKMNYLKQLILHENALENLPEGDTWLLNTLKSKFQEHFGFSPFGTQWCPHSFLAAWLGLTVYDGCVAEEELEEFCNSDETENFQMVGRDGRAIKNLAQEQPVIPVELHDVDKPDSEDDDDLELIEVEDQWEAISRNRQLDTDATEEVKPFAIPSLRSNDWAVNVAGLADPFYLTGIRDSRELQRPEFENYRQMGLLRQKIAMRELQVADIMRDEEILLVASAWDLSLADRWRLYRRWVAQVIISFEETLDKLQKNYEISAKRLKEIVNAEELGILRGNDVIGLTTTGAAKYLESIKELGPKIVIVEEAAEVLEAHIITSLSKETEHLILIGDHQQLRPNITVYQLAEKYHLDVSLFERMIKNEVRYETLQLQHRMRPEISRLLVPHIYKNLEDHPSVKNRSPILGTRSSVFFVSHSNPEEAVSDTKTHKNTFEAEFLVGLCHYFLQQGYQPSQITILTAYAGQLFAIRKLMKKETFEGVQVTVVDNYQGEENDIILLSFVRSNEEGKIGFLKIDNRVNVALSRAKRGLFCVGNFRFFASKSELWREICRDLERTNMIGEEMSLICQKHGVASNVRKGSDFKLVVPEGGCLQQCGESFPCGHICSRVCHNTKHTNCEEICNKIICGLEHRCPIKCYQPCEPCRQRVLKHHLHCEHAEVVACHVDIGTVLCRRQVERTLPACGHPVMLECNVDFTKYLCKKIVTRDLPACGHVRDMECHKDATKIDCLEKCDVRLDCGHVCPRKCHPLDDADHERVQCQKKCQKKICDNGHLCKMLCHQPCNECKILVDKKRPCGHEVKYPCSKPLVERTLSRTNNSLSQLFARMKAKRDELGQLSSRLSEMTDPTFSRDEELKTSDSWSLEPCDKPCLRFLSCGHKCKQICSEPCGNCEEIVDRRLLCGHLVKAPCGKAISTIACTSPCAKALSCGHACSKRCGEPCATKCQKLMDRVGACGHLVKSPCHAKNASLEEIAFYCKTPCKRLLPCEHECVGTCGQCRQGRVHVSCKSECGRPQICGHSCTYPCAKKCPPCNRKCATVCSHSRCPKKCGQPCKRCNEDCEWRCAHHRCTKKCCDNCDRPPCNEPCLRKLRCGHPCIGLCGEKCPRLCRICNREELTEFILYGYEDDEDSRFIELVDCHHCIEVRALDHFMGMENESDQNETTKEIAMKRCPRCNTTIWRSFRYGNVIRRRMADVQRVKKVLFGKNKLLRKKMIDTLGSIQKDTKMRSLFREQTKFLVKRLSSKQQVHQNEMEVIENQVNLLKAMSTLRDKADKNLNSVKAKRFLSEEIIFLSNRLMENKENVNDWELESINRELTRSYLTALYLDVKEETLNFSASQQQLSRVKTLLSSPLSLTTEEEKKIEEYIEKATSRRGLGISDEERVQIIRAMSDVKSGSWYACPNGHIYCIGECGGATERGRCNECGATVGGENHRLVSDNVHAAEMDRSARPSWPPR